MLMTAKPRPAVALTSDHLKTIADQLAEWSETLRKVAEVADKQENKEIAIFNWLSVPKGLQLIESFVVKANESRRLAQLGTPVQSGELKARSRAKFVAEDADAYTKSSDSPTHPTAADVDAVVRSATKRATPKPPADSKAAPKKKRAAE